MEGWLVKKNKNRYFILKGKILYWFVSKQSPSADLPALSRGSLNLEKCVINPPDKPLTLKITAPFEVYVMKGKTNEEIESWTKALIQAVKAVNETKVKTGYMEKQNKRKFFVLKGTQFQWFDNEQEGAAKGTIDLTGCSLGPFSDNNSFLLSVPYLNNKQIKLTCFDGNTEGGWYLAIQAAIDSGKTELDPKSKENMVDLHKDVEKEGWLDKKGKRRYFKLHNHNLTWYDSDPKIKNIEINGTLNLKGCQVVVVGFAITIKPTVGKSYTLRAASQAEADDWAKAFNRASSKVLSLETQKVNIYEIKKREGWVIKKGVGKVVGQTRRQLKRYIKIDITTSTLKYFDSDQSNANPKGEIYLAGCRTCAFDEKTFMVLTGHGRDFPFECKDREEVEDWVKSIQYYINRADSDIQKAVMKHQWLIGGRAQSDRWVVITKDNLLLWFGQVCPPQDIVPEKSNGWVKINQTKFEPHPEIKNAFLLTPEKSPAVIFTCPDSNTYEGWYGYLKSISEGGDGKIEEKRLVFGRDLEQLLQSEDINIPKLVVKCAEFIRNNGTDVKGIFRLSGQADEIQTYTKAFDRGEDVIFTIEADVNAVAGVLKSFFRAMPEPAIPSSLYQLFLSVSDIPSAIAALKELPKANYDLMNYLCHFLFEMAQYVEVTSMNFENISIVFAPNLLRSTDPNCLSGLTDTPKVLRSIQFLVENYQHIWTEGPPVVSEKGRVHAIHSETSDFLPMHKESVPVRIPKSNTFSYQNAPPKVSSFHSPSLPPSDIPPPLRSPSPSYSVPLPHAPSLPPSDLPPPLLPPSSPTSSSPPMATPLPSIPPPALSTSPPLGNSPPNQNNIPNTGPPTTNPPPPDNPPATNPPTDSPLSSDIPVQSTSPPPSQSLRSNSETSLLSTFLSDPAAIPPLPSSPSNPSSLRSNSTLSSSSPFNRPESELTSPRSSNSSNNLWSSNQGILPREVSKPKLFKGSRTLGSNRATMQIKSPLNFDMDPKKPNAALPEEE